MELKYTALALARLCAATSIALVDLAVGDLIFEAVEEACELPLVVDDIDDGPVVEVADDDADVVMVLLRRETRLPV